MSILSICKKIYETSWSLKRSEKLSDADIQEVLGNRVVESEYGKSVMLTLKGGKVSFIPLSRDSQDVEVGQVLDLKAVKVLTLSKEGSEDIYRIEV